ncbi:MAG: flagellar hook-basal body protein [Bacillota bacterium]
MLKAISQNYSGLRGFQQLLDVTAHNIANVNTVAFKEKQVSFFELTYRELAERRLPHAGNPPMPPQSGRGTAVSSIVLSREQGSLAYTGRNLDLAVVGEGFFRVVRPDGSYAYTRSGNFALDADGNLTMPGGVLLDPPLYLREQEGRIDFGTLAITPAGIVQAAPLRTEAEDDFSPFPPGAEEETPAAIVELGQLYLYQFINPQSLSAVGDNLLLPSAASGPPLEGLPGEEGYGEIRHGYLENANVDLARQITTLMRGQRALQANSRAMSIADELWALTLNLQS